MHTATAQYGDLFVGRQPILGPNLKTIGYEILYRNCEMEQANFADESVATATVLLNTYLDIGLEHVVGSHLAFLNIPQNFLLEKYCETLPKNRVVLEVLENVEPIPRVVEALAGLKKQGYTLALDDFIFHDRYHQFLEMADIVKVDVLGKTESQLEDEVRQLRHYRVRLLAEKVENRKMYQLCKDLGFYYFQGHFFYRPDVVKGREIPANRIALVELLGKIQNPYVPFHGLVEHIRNDLSLSYKVLQYVNSAYVGLPRRVESIDHAACLVGVDRIRTWATLIIMASDKQQPIELLVMALVRAKMCERLGKIFETDSPEKYFTMGLLSVLDALYETDMEHILEKLPLPEDIVAALVEGTGSMGSILNAVKAYEDGEWIELKSLQLEPSTIRNLYIESIDWANQFTRILK